MRDANHLLDPGYRALESGWVRLDDGQLHRAALTTMVGCKGAMIDWWFGWLRTTEQYQWWRPKDHVWCEWDGERGSGRYVGSTHHVHEYIGSELMKLKIGFRDPSEYLAVARFAEAGVATAICARSGALEAPVWAGHLVHLVRDTPYGCEMHSRFWLGDFDPPALAPDRAARMAFVPDHVGPDLQKHCQKEMGYLAAFLPGLYARETGR